QVNTIAIKICIMDILIAVSIKAFNRLFFKPLKVLFVNVKVSYRMNFTGNVPQRCQHF
ncbi:MAG: hypothetical protein JWQ28_217, partial [Pedobacter sp.]|nr:hypothetical protein [Pedobacter sp.]